MDRNKREPLNRVAIQYRARLRKIHIITAYCLTVNFSFYPTPSP